MKKLLLLVIVLALGCEAADNTKKSNKPPEPYTGYNYEDKIVDGMRYRIYRSKYDSAGVIIVNITRDKLECEYLKQQLLDKDKPTDKIYPVKIK